MNEVLNLARSSASGAVPAAVGRSVLCDEDGERTPLAFHLELQSTQALLTALATVARLGGRIAFVRAAERQADIGLLALPHTAHRLRLVLAQLVEVLAVVAIDPNEPPGTAA
jgi:hypothetical protein